MSSALQGPPGQTVYEEIVALEPPGRSRGHEPVDPRVNSRMYEAEDPTGAKLSVNELGIESAEEHGCGDEGL